MQPVFTQERLELTPSAVVPQQELFRVPNPGTIDWSNASKEHMDLFNATMKRMQHRVKNRRILCKPVFKDFDRSDYNYSPISLINILQSVVIIELYALRTHFAASPVSWTCCLIKAPKSVHPKLGTRKRIWKVKVGWL